MVHRPQTLLNNGDDNPEVLSAMLMLFNISHLFSLWCHCCHPDDFKVDILLPCQKDKILKVSDIRSILNCDCIQATKQIPRIRNPSVSQIEIWAGGQIPVWVNKYLENQVIGLQRCKFKADCSPDLAYSSDLIKICKLI